MQRATSVRLATGAQLELQLRLLVLLVTTILTKVEAVLPSVRFAQQEPPAQTVALLTRL